MYGYVAKKIWLPFQSYHSEENPSTIDGIGRRAEDVAERKALVAASNELKLFGKTACVSCHAACTNLIVRPLNFLLGILLTILLSDLEMQLNSRNLK